MKKQYPYREIPPINPVCRYTVWIVDYGNNTTSNPMSKKKAVAMMEKLISEGKKPMLIKAWSCVSADKLDPPQFETPTKKRGK